MENNKPLVSVIMNCYNSDKYLKEAIDSVLSQTYENWEIVFWDNQSKDKSAEIVKSYNDKRIKYFYAPVHTNLGKARNLAVEQSTGDWINFLDCDDMLDSDKLELQMANVHSENIGLVYGKMRFLVEESGVDSIMSKNIRCNIYPNIDLPSGDIFELLLFDCFIPLPSVLIRKDIFNLVHGIDARLKVVEDYDLFLKVTRKSTAVGMQRACCTYRVHGNNLSHLNMHTTFFESIFVVGKYIWHWKAVLAIIKWLVRYIWHIAVTIVRILRASILWKKNG